MKSVCWESCGGGTCNLPENQLGWCRPFQKNPVENQPRYVPVHHWEAVNMTKAGSIAPGVHDKVGVVGRLLGNGEMFELIRQNGSSPPIFGVKI